MPPSLASYQKAASQIYNPQQQAEARTLATNEKTTTNTLEAQKGQIQTDYQSAVDNLNQTLKGNIAQINQLYTERLGGNFSGLQGNDIGGAVSTALKQQGMIESTRANKLSDIATSETNAKLTYNTELGNLGSKYSSLKSQYANDAYGKAVTDYNTNQYRQQELSLRAQSEADTNSYRQAELGLSSARLNLDAQKSAGDATKGYGATAKKGNAGFAYHGPNGQSLNLGMYAKSLAGSPGEALGIIRNQLQASTSPTDKAALRYFNSQVTKYKGNFNKVVGAISNKKQYASLFNGM